MTARSVSAFLLSAALHALAVGLLVLLSYTAARRTEDTAKVFELVAGEGDNFAATEAPALGTPGVRLNVATPPPRKVEPTPPAPQPVAPEPVPIKPAPAPTKTPEQTIPNFTKKIKRDMIVAESKAKREIAKKRAEEKRRAEEEAKRLSKEEFDRLHKSKAHPSASRTKSSPVKIAKIDTEGIVKGVTGGSTRNKTGGAGGKALVSKNDDLLGKYFAMFKQRVLARFERPPNVSENLIVEVEFISHADGTISNARVAKSSGSRDFDQAVLDAMRRVTMPARPDKKTELVTFELDMRERDEP